MPINISGITLGQSTKDATAIPEDVKSGKSFYGASGKQVGTGIILNHQILRIPKGTKTETIPELNNPYAGSFRRKSEINYSGYEHGDLCTGEEFCFVYYNTKDRIGYNASDGYSFDVNIPILELHPIKISIGQYSLIVDIPCVFSGVNGVFGNRLENINLGNTYAVFAYKLNSGKLASFMVGSTSGNWGFNQDITIDLKYGG